MNLRLSTAVALSLVASVVNAADSTEIDTVMVTGTLENDDSPLNPVRLPQSARISSQVLDAADVDKLQARDVYDLLNYGTGIFTVTSGKKSPATLNIRGDSNFAFVVDGAYLPPQLSSRILQVIPASAIEEVRIVRTSTALTINPLVGIASPSGASNNGFIVVRTRRPTETRAALEVHAGSYSTRGASGAVGTAFGENGVDGYLQVYGADYRTDGPRGFNLDKEYDAAGLRAGIRVGKMSVDLSLLKSWAGYGIVRANGKLRPTTVDDVWRLDPMNSSVATLNATINWDARNTSVVTVARTISDGKFVTADLLPAGLANQVTRDNNNRFTNAALRHNLFLGEFKAQFGADRIHWDNPSGQYYYEGIAREEKVSGYFVQFDRAMFDERLNLDAGWRSDRVEVVKGIDYFRPGAQPAANVRKLVDQKLPAAKYVSAGASYAAAQDWLFNVRYSRSTQPARPGVVLADPATPLNGESRTKLELGVEARLAPWINPSANFFTVRTANELTPLSYAVVAGEQVAKYGNTDSKRSGVEVVAAGSWGESAAPGGYRFSVTHYLDVLDPTGLLARTQPRTVGELTLEQSFAGWRGVLAAKRVGRYESNAFVACAAPNLNCTGGAVSPYLPLGDYLNLDFNLSRRFNVGNVPVRATFSGKNLLDDNYETSIGYPSIGRQFGISLSAVF